jgi:hypothetical protein
MALAAPVAAWSSYLDAVEAAATAVVERVREGRTPLWPDLQPPSVPFPGDLSDRRTQVTAALTRATDETASRHDSIAKELTAMRPRRGVAGAGTRSGSLGGNLDVVG